MKTYVTPKVETFMLELPDIMAPSAENTVYGARVDAANWTFTK